jgi:hypothetical protein
MENIEAEVDDRRLISKRFFYFLKILGALSFEFLKCNNVELKLFFKKLLWYKKNRIYADFESAEKAVKSSLKVKKPKKWGKHSYVFYFFAHNFIPWLLKSF